ncbi:hypothetical protein [Zeaxanthinibacter enoshimensis]|uniref:hypothetical protein n=1 Tax=Zeaxanthinibacter enoshimensis TaxID=392009 RepID=UPI003567C9B2
MKRGFPLLLICLWAVLSSFGNKKDCVYAGSNISFIQSQTEKAIAATELKMSRYYAYKAINGIENSRKQMESCGCKEARDILLESLELLKRAAKADSMRGGKILLYQSLELTLETKEAINQHDLFHITPYTDELIKLDPAVAMSDPSIKDTVAMQERIDRSLQGYKESLELVVETVNCEEAFAFAEKIYKHSEQQLLRKDLTEAQQYYHYRTQLITSRAMTRLLDCAN